MERFRAATPEPYSINPKFQIAASRGIKTASVESALADAILSGRSYPWHHLRIPQVTHA